jgi:hypothetical protein
VDRLQDNLVDRVIVVELDEAEAALLVRSLLNHLLTRRKKMFSQGTRNEGEGSVEYPH